MWTIHQISFLNSKDNVGALKPTLHLTNSNGEGRSIPLEISGNDIRRFTIQQLEDIANGLTDIKTILNQPS
ncbi:hypothetical protein [Pseudocitrobacter vendiensis]|uniref:Uncharacterized protein n=1 Tax=Pseudocitrobacter vendiensis TaxID=2488306 RepID=A0ABN8T7V5_9ENTR|nr:hypothetical protein [Pseudocitrobacter vendiensis]CAH6636070.1 hypothetical protein FBBNIHIM_04480 [Pseudocitrobacter vendiensis]